VLEIGASLRRAGALAEVTFAGDGPLVDELRASARELGIAAEFVGYVHGARLENLWSEASCLVLPSLRDPAPLVLSEAAARGIPFVCSSSCGSGSTLASLGARARVVDVAAPIEDWRLAVEAVLGPPARPVTEVLPAASGRRVWEFLRSVWNDVSTAAEN
jgi:glycosyltransferase involved in cell wall biosynthesis